MPDEITILNFRRLLETHSLARKVLATVNAYLTDKGLLLRQGAFFNVTVIHAPSSTKNKAKARDPEMHQARQDQKWYIGMKAHIGADVESGLAHTVTTTAASVTYVAKVAELTQGKEKTLYAQAGYIGAEKRVPKLGRKWHIAAKRGSIKAMPEGDLKDAAKHVEHMKAAVRSKVEHPFRVVKRQIGYQKVRFRGLAKNTARILALFALSNLWMMRRTLLARAGEVCP